MEYTSTKGEEETISYSLKYCAYFFLLELFTSFTRSNMEGFHPSRAPSVTTFFHIWEHIYLVENLELLQYCNMKTFRFTFCCLLFQT